MERTCLYFLPGADVRFVDFHQKPINGASILFFFYQQFMKKQVFNAVSGNPRSDSLCLLSAWHNTHLDISILLYRCCYTLQGHNLKEI
jgi:hypothetical protein